MYGIITAARWRRRPPPDDPLTQIRKALCERYDVARKLGEGGMADVYLADDLRHGREVAIKVLKPEVVGSVGAARFLSEIRLTARLRHPNILPLYDSEEAAGLLFYVMPYVEGESLAERLRRERQLPVEEAARIVLEVAEALDYAHGRGVVHRDVKPSNILLERGHAVVADFGIARAVTSATLLVRRGGTDPSPATDGSGPEGLAARETPASSGRLTGTGTTIGSPHYMSPEQATGRAEVDARSDLYSLACVTYEMLVGEPPFTGPTPLVVMARHALDPVPPLTTARPGVPSRVVAAVERALAKTPADRFQTVRAFADEMATATQVVPEVLVLAATDAPAPVEKPSIAVLPFVNLCENPGQAFFVAGVHDAVIAELSKLGALSVISRTTMLRYENTRLSIPEIASQLGVCAVMEGSVCRWGDRVRISLQLLQGSREETLWAETYEHDLTDVLAIHAEVARSVAKAVHATLSEEDEARLASAAPIDPKVYELFLRARYQTAFLPAEAYRAVHYFERAIERAPDFAPAHSGLARRYVWMASLGFEPGIEMLPRAAAAAARAHELDPSSADALAVLGYLRFVQDWDAAGAREALERAIQLEPGNLDALVDLIFLLCAVGEFAAAETYIHKVRDLDPLSPSTSLMRGWSHLMAGRFEEAVNCLEVGAERHPTFAYFTVFAALAEVLRGKSARALELARKAEAIDPATPNLDILNILGAVYAWVGAQEEARRIVARAEAQLMGEDGAWFRWLTRFILGDTQEALHWFDLAFEHRNPMLVLLPVHPVFAVAREHPYMGERIRAMGLVTPAAQPSAESPAAVTALPGRA